MARTVLKYLNNYRRGIRPSYDSESDHEDFSSSSSDDEDVAVEEKFANMRLTPPRTHLKRNRKKSPKISSTKKHIEEKFANMRLSPPQTHVKRNRKKSPRISSTKKHVKFAKTSALHSRAKVNKNGTEVIHPVLPITVYDYIKEAVGIMDRPGWSIEVLADEHDLLCCEGRIRVACSYYREDLPVGWKYERDNARYLIADYDLIFNEDHLQFIV